VAFIGNGRGGRIGWDGMVRQKGPGVSGSSDGVSISRRAAQQITDGGTRGVMWRWRARARLAARAAHRVDLAHCAAPALRAHSAARIACVRVIQHYSPLARYGIKQKRHHRAIAAGWDGGRADGWMINGHPAWRAARNALVRAAAQHLRKNAAFIDRGVITRRDIAQGVENGINVMR